MGRNGTKPPVFLSLAAFVNSRVGQEVSLNEILLGKEYGRNAETSYLYKIIKLGYVQITSGDLKEKNAELLIVRPFPVNYNSTKLDRDLKLFNSLV